MLLRNIQEAPLIRANFLLNQEKSKKGIRAIQSEIEKLSELFGIEFDKGLYCLLLDDIDFKEIKSLLNNKNIRIQVFLQSIQRDIEKDDFMNFLAEVFMKTKNTNSVAEIIDGLQKANITLSNENLLKLYVSFILSKNPLYYDDALLCLKNKCKELEKKNKIDEINPLLSQEIILILSKKNNKINGAASKENIQEKDSEKENEEELCFYNYPTLINNPKNIKSKNNLTDMELLFSMTNESDDEDSQELIPIEKLYEDLGPMIINNSINLPSSKLIDNSMNSKKIAGFILNVLKKPIFTEDKEVKIMNKVFLKSLEMDKEAKSIDESSEKQQVEWNIENFYKMYKSQIDIINPKDIFDNLDDPSFVIKDKKKFDFFISILKNLFIIRNNNFDLFFEFIFNKWTNEENQIDFLKYLVNNPQSDSFTFKNYKGKRIKQHFELNSISKSSSSFLIDPWTCISLLEVLLRLSHGNNYVKVKELFDWPIQNIPEIIALGLMQITQKPSDFLYDELIQEVLTLFLGNHMNSFTVIEEVWNANKELVINAIANMYNSSPDLMNLSRILDITQKLKESLLLLVNCNDYKFAVNLAILAVKRDFLHIEQWLKERIESVGDDFITALVDYIKENLLVHCKSNNKNKEGILEKSQLTIESLAVILENLISAKHSTNPKISASTEQEVQEIYKSIFETFKELNLEPLNSKEIEDTANSIFQSMFKGETKVSETIDQLKKLKDSKVQKDREIYACMIHCLLDEYRFYHQYPEKQLNIVSNLFGQIINNKLIDGVIETIALKYILEGIRKGNGPLFIFGTTALQQFIDKLQQLPSYTKSLVDTKQLKNDPILYESVIEKYSLIFSNDPATNSLAANNNFMNNNNNMNPTMNNNNTLNNLMNQQNMNVGLIPPLGGNIGVNPLGQNNNIPTLQQQMKNKMYSPTTNPGPGNMFDNNDIPVSPLVMKTNSQHGTINQNENNFSQMMYNVQNNNKNPAGGDQYFGLNGLNNNMNPNMPINTQLLQPNIPQGIGNLVNNAISNINIPNPAGMDTNNIFNNSNGNALNSSMTSLSSQTHPASSLLNNSNTMSNNNNLNLNDSLTLSGQNIDEKSPAKRKIRRQSSSNTNNPNPNINMNMNMNNNLNNSGAGDYGMNTIMNNSNINSSNNNLVELFSNDQEHKILPPSQEIAEQIQFTFNQLNNINQDEKGKEISKIIGNNDNNLRWFSDYFIVNRISNEINNHPRYFSLVKAINSKELINYQIRDTIYYIHKLLQTKKLEDQKERNILKCFGNWLGLLTLSREKPILARDLDFRELLANAYESGKLIAIIPFVTKVLENSKGTKVFHNKNPWLMSILSIINEILVMPDLRSMLIFDIEELFKNLGIDITTFPISNFLDSKIPNKNSQDFNTNSISFNNNNNSNMSNNSSFTQNSFTNIGPGGNNTNNSSKILGRVNPTNKGSSSSINQEEQQYKKEFVNKIYNCSMYLMEMTRIFEAHNMIGNGYINKNEIIGLVTKILSESINNIINPVIERAVNISLVTTKELVIKDFQFEPNEKKFKIAATNSIKSLAGALALVTCKEPLRMSYCRKLKDFLAERHIDNNTIDEILKIRLTGELLNIGCSHIYNFVQKKAAEAVLKDETIVKEIERRSNNDNNSLSKNVFCNDNNQQLMKIVSKLPSSLKPNPNGLTKEQLAIYDNYPKIYGESINMDINANKMNNNNSIGNSNTIYHIRHVLKEVLERPNNVLQKIIKSYDVCMQNMQTLMKDYSNNNLDNSLNNGTNEFEEGSEELKICESSITENKIKSLNYPEQEESKLIIQMAVTSYKYALIAFEHQYHKLLNVYIAFIKGWIKSSNANIQKEITNKLMNNTLNQICFNADFHSILLARNIIDINDYQDFILNYLELPNTQKQCINLLNGLKKIGIYNPTNNVTFPKIYPIFLNEKKCYNYFRLFGKGCKLPSDLKIISQQVIDYKICNIKDLKTYQLFNKMCYLAFNKIIGTKYPYVLIEPAELGHKLSNFIESPFVNNDEQLNVFIMLITELCVKHISNSNTISENYPDNQAKCIYTLLMAVPNTANKLKMFGNILNGIFKTFHHDYVKTNLNFNQRPYYKLFYTFIALLDKFSNDEKIFNSDNTKIQYMNLIAEFFKMLSPPNYPGFGLAWLDLISSKPFINSFLCDIDTPGKERNTQVLENYLYLIIDLFTFIKNCSNLNLNEFTSKIFMDNVYKYMFLLSKSYPAFVSGYYYIFLISLPPDNSYSQLKNLILSTIPKTTSENMYKYNFIDKDLNQEFINNTLAENKVENLFDILSMLKLYKFLTPLDEYLETQKGELIKTICDNLNMSKNKTFNFYVINAIVIYWAEKIIKNQKNSNEPFVFFYQMIQFLEVDNRDHLITSLLNELRYPSNQTLYFLLMLNYILCEIHNESIEEHIIMLLFERLLIKPIPWGIELMFNKLLKGEKYVILNKNFLRNFNGGIGFIKSIKDFVGDKNAQKYNLFKYIGHNKTNMSTNNNNLNNNACIPSAINDSLNYDKKDNIELLKSSSEEEEKNDPEH